MKIEQKYEQARRESARLRHEISKLARAATAHADQHQSTVLFQAIADAYKATADSIIREKAVAAAGPNSFMVEFDGLDTAGPQGGHGPLGTYFTEDTPMGSVAHVILGAGGGGGSGRGQIADSEWKDRLDPHDHGLSMRAARLLDLRKFRCAYPYRPEEKRVSIPWRLILPHSRGVKGGSR